MPDVELTPLERGVLLVLMAEGRPLKENAELREIHGISITASHRNKLQRLGLIRTTSTAPLTHSLSKKGWEWARNEMSAPKPKGQMGLGALYAVLHGLGRHIELHGYRLEGVFSETADNVPKRGLEGYMREAAWSEADEALGQALQDMQVFTKAIEILKGASSAELAAPIKRARLAANLVLQSVRYAAHMRELNLGAEAGTVTTYDPVMHHSDEMLKPGANVRIRKAPVLRGPADASVVVLRGEVEPV